MVTGAPVRQAPTTTGGSTAPERKLPIDYEHRYTDTGPKSRLLSGTMREYGADPIGAMRRWRDLHGDFVPIRFGPFPAHMAYGPAEIQEVLVDRAADFRKSFGTRMLIPLLGNGLLTAEGDEWLRHRRLASPAFHRERVEGYGLTMAGYAEDSVDSWTDGEVLDLHDEMTALTLRIVARTLFDNDVTARIDGGRRAWAPGSRTSTTSASRASASSSRHGCLRPATASSHERRGASTMSSTGSSASAARARTAATCSRCCSWHATSRAPGCPSGRSATR